MMMRSTKGTHANGSSQVARTLLLLEARCCPADDRFTRAKGMIFLVKLSLAAVLLATALSQVGCRDGLLQPDPELEPDSGGCGFFFFVMPTPDSPYESQGMLTNLIVNEIRSSDEYDMYDHESRDSMEALVEAAALEVVARFPEQVRADFDLRVEAASAAALDHLLSVQ